MKKTLFPEYPEVNPPRPVCHECKTDLTREERDEIVCDVCEAARLFRRCHVRAARAFADAYVSADGEWLARSEITIAGLLMRDAQARRLCREIDRGLGNVGTEIDRVNDAIRRNDP